MIPFIKPRKEIVIQTPPGQKVLMKVSAEPTSGVVKWKVLPSIQALKRRKN